MGIRKEETGSIFLCVLRGLIPPDPPDSDITTESAETLTSQRRVSFIARPSLAIPHLLEGVLDGASDARVFVLRIWFLQIDCIFRKNLLGMWGGRGSEWKGGEAR